jgi:hypothetical protein
MFVDVVWYVVLVGGRKRQGPVVQAMHGIPLPSCTLRLAEMTFVARRSSPRIDSVKLGERAGPLHGVPAACTGPQVRILPGCLRHMFKPHSTPPLEAESSRPPPALLHTFFGTNIFRRPAFGCCRSSWIQPQDPPNHLQISALYRYGTILIGALD